MLQTDLLEALPLCAVFCVLGILLLTRTREHHETVHFQVKLFLLAFVLRFAMSMALYEFGLLDVIKDEDASGWINGLWLKQVWERYAVGILDLPAVLLEAFGLRHQGYVYMLASLFFVWDFGTPGRMVAAALNCFLGALTVILVYRTTRTLFDSAVAARVGWWTTLFPSLIIWSAQTIKEPVVIFLESVALYCCVQMRRRGWSVKYALICLAAVVLLKPFRFYAMVITGAVAVLAAIPLSRILPTLPIRTAVGVGGALLIITSLSGSGALSEEEGELVNLEYMAKYREGAARFAQSGVETNYDLKTPAGFGMATLVGAAHVLFAPFPWQWAGGSLRLLLVVPEVIVWWWMFVKGVIPGLRLTLKTRYHDVEPILLFIVGFALLYGMLFGNVGLAYRQRAQLLPSFFIFAAAWFEQLRAKRAATQPAARSGTLAPAI